MGLFDYNSTSIDIAGNRVEHRSRIFTDVYTTIDNAGNSRSRESLFGYGW